MPRDFIIILNNFWKDSKRIRVPSLRFGARIYYPQVPSSRNKQKRDSVAMGSPPLNCHSHISFQGRAQVLDLIEVETNKGAQLINGAEDCSPINCRYMLLAFLGALSLLALSTFQLSCARPFGQALIFSIHSVYGGSYTCPSGRRSRSRSSYQCSNSRSACHRDYMCIYTVLCSRVHDAQFWMG